MRLVFIGVHNKPNMLPLDSRTYTGKIVDEIAARAGIECVKTNLINKEYAPKSKAEIEESINEWHQMNRIHAGDILILLGGYVQKHFIGDMRRAICIAHPGSLVYGNNKEAYLLNAVSQIGGMLTQ